MANISLLRRPQVPDGIEQPAVAAAQDGVFSRAQARAEGWSDGRSRRLIRSGLWVPLSGSVLHHRDVAVGPWQRARTVWLTGSLVVSHSTAGQLLGLEIEGALHGTIGTSRRGRSVTVHRADLRADDVIQVAGLRVIAPMRTLTDILCSQPLENSIAMVTDALRRGMVSTHDLEQVAARATGRHGAARVRFVARTCASRPHSVLEWQFHQLIGQLGPGWRFNVEVKDARGVIGVVDALHVPSMTVVELDGRSFHGPDRFQFDRTRDQRLAAAGFVVLRFTWQDVHRRSVDVLERIRRTTTLRMPRSA